MSWTTGTSSRPPGRAWRLHGLRAWSFKPGNTLLEKWIKTYKAPTPISGCSPLPAVPRQFRARAGLVVLRGQADGPGGPALGLDDFGGTLFEEKSTPPRFRQQGDRGRDHHLDREAGFTPVQRTTEYEILKVY